MLIGNEIIAYKEWAGINEKTNPAPRRHAGTDKSGIHQEKLNIPIPSKAKSQIDTTDPSV